MLCNTNGVQNRQEDTGNEIFTGSLVTGVAVLALGAAVVTNKVSLLQIARK